MIIQQKLYGFTFLQIALEIESEFQKFGFFRFYLDRFNMNKARLDTLTIHTKRFIEQQLIPYFEHPEKDISEIGDGTILDNLVADYYRYEYWEGLEIY